MPELGFGTVERFARRQMGLVTRQQLLSSGIGYSTIRGWVVQGRIVVVGRRTFRVASVAATRQGSVLAACLDVDGVASHWTAAWLHGIASAPPTIDVLVRKRGVGRSALLQLPCGEVTVRSTTSLPTDDVTTVGAIPATSVARTLLGLAAFVPRTLRQKALLATICRTIEMDLASESWLWWLLEHRRCSGRNGVLAFEAAMAERSRLGPTESWLEREFLRLLERLGIPLPAVQRIVRRQGRFVARVDFAFEGTPIVVEVLGYRYHRTREQLEADARRVTELQLAGKVVLQFTAEQIATRPEWVGRTTHEALRRYANAA